MKAFHIIWTLPYVLRSGSRHFQMHDFDLLTMILSALKWRELNGSIQMIIDELGYRFFEERDLLQIWDGGVHPTLDRLVTQHIHPQIFWAAAKLFALREQETPCVMMDTDFIVWESLGDCFPYGDVGVIHRESITSNVYPAQSSFSMKSSYRFDPNWDWGERPANTAFAYFGHQHLKDEYVSRAIEFMENTYLPDNRLTYMVFAEQRLLPMICKQQRVKLFEFASLETLFEPEQSIFTHVWGHKQRLLEQPQQRARFCRDCVQRIITDYPEMEQVLQGISEVNTHLTRKEI